MKKYIFIFVIFSFSFLFITSLSFAQWQNLPIEIPASDGANLDEYGFSVATSFDTAIVGAPYHNGVGEDSGAAYIRYRSSGSWDEEIKLQASDGAAFDQFGYSVAIDGDLAVIGAANEGNTGEYTQGHGSVYVYRNNGATWVEEQKLIASDAEIGDDFGGIVAVSGNAILVSAMRADNDAGAVYVFRYNGQTWIEETKITPPPSAGNIFGITISLSADVAVIGNASNLVNGPASGAAYVYRKNGTNWVEEQMLFPLDGAANDLFSFSVSIWNDVIAVGASSDDDNAPNSGSAYVFRFNGQTWIQEAKLLASNGAGSDHFGKSIAIDGDLIVAGAPGRDNEDLMLPDFGGAYVFRYQAGAWNEEAFLLPQTTWFQDEFGNTVSITGNTVLVGAHQDDPSGFDSGNAFIFEGEPIPTECTGDIDGNNIVDIQDFLALLAAWGPNPGHAADFNDDGVVDIQDFLDLLAAWGPCP